MSIRKACAVLGFHSPPVDKKQLKTRFIELTKKHHPDRGGADACSTKMADIAESYKVLKTVIEQKVSSGGGTGRKQQGDCSSGACAGGTDARDRDMKEAAASFQSPSVGASTDGMWLPWQREPSSSRKLQEQNLFKSPSTSSTSFVDFVRQAKQTTRRHAESRREAQESGQGSHGYTAQHMEHQRQMREAFSTSNSTLRSSSLLSLAVVYFKDKVRHMPAQAIRSLKFILQGK